MRFIVRAALAIVLLATLAVPGHAAPAMWQVSDGDSKVWLFGSIHVLKPGTSWRTPALETAVKDAEAVYFEADIGPLGMVGIVIKSLAAAFGTQPVPWTDSLTAEQTAKLTRAVTPLGFTVKQLDGYAPWLAQGMIEDKIMQGLGYKGQLGVDSTLQGELPKERKAYFETAGAQMDMMASAPVSEQLSRLLASLDDLDNVPAELDALATAWLSGKTGDIEEKLAGDPTLDEAFTQTMVFDRNRKWVAEIGQLLAGNHEDLVVVGAAHLVGNDSVVDLLGKAGFTVERIQ